MQRMKVGQVQILILLFVSVAALLVTIVSSRPYIVWYLLFNVDT